MARPVPPRATWSKRAIRPHRRGATSDDQRAAKAASRGPRHQPGSRHDPGRTTAIAPNHASWPFA